MKEPVNSNLAVREKQQRVIVIEARERPQNVKLRVAAYARVSTNSEDQLNSFSAQNSYYTTLIASKENWVMVDIYADRGKSGTSTKKRNDFQRLLSDCRKGLIDHILCKSISRFARNTKECLEIIRELKTLGIGVCFEKENINTAEMSGEMLTALFSSISQSESESISGNMRWSYRERMEQGTFIPPSLPFGYMLEDGRIKVHPEQAVIVKRIFREYLDGSNAEEIAERLRRDQIAGKSGKATWTPRAIRYILTNERYTGNSVWQKYYMTDTLPYRKVQNHGEKQSYFAQNTHEAIITDTEFTSANRLLQDRAAKSNHTEDRSTTEFHLKITCDTCGSRFRRKKIRGRAYWACVGHDSKQTDCPITQIPESEIQSAFLRLYYKLKHQASVLPQFLTHLREIRSHRMLWSTDIIELNKRISNITSQNQLLAMLKQQGGVDPDIFISRSNELAEQLRTAKQAKERLLNMEGDETIIQTQELIEVIETGPDFLDEFDGELFGELIDRIIVESNERLRFRLKNGLELAESIKRTMR